MKVYGRAPLWAVGLVCFYVLVTVPLGVSKRRSAKDWDKIATHHLGEVEQQWRDGDEEPELITEDQEEYNRMEARKNSVPEIPANFESVDPQEWMKASTGCHGPYDDVRKTEPNVKKRQKNFKSRY